MYAIPSDDNAPRPPSLADMIKSEESVSRLRCRSTMDVRNETPNHDPSSISSESSPYSSKSLAHVGSETRSFLQQASTYTISSKDSVWRTPGLSTIDFPEVDDTILHRHSADRQLVRASSSDCISKLAQLSPSLRATRVQTHPSSKRMSERAPVFPATIPCMKFADNSVNHVLL